ncbi:NAD(P)-binding protein [Myriangium duriaei CBS 260.36]|uniref:NAD(P)-binding protein n=1 Tax=Myriangium duriaei CBS 260.36 TaxID=1168546 RepID=A0A9P4MHY1_9PEZI|nr:NAD(P)-binding protein [Myriangium duriaei CBS 260.36]
MASVSSPLSNPPSTQPQLLSNQVAIITGGTTGIGRAIALSFLSHGAKVCINHLSSATSSTVIDSLRSSAGHHGSETHLLFVAGDISLPSTATDLVTTTVSRFGRVDIFVSNAGVCQFHDFLSLPPDLLTSTISTNLTGAFYAVQAAARQMAAQTPPGGSIIGISSISALVGGAGQTHYTPTKAGVLSLMQSCACALGKYNIRCNALLPGTIRTGMNDADLGDEEKRTRMEGRVPLGRLGRPEDMAGPAVFLASDLSGYVTGAQLLVDGGAFVNLQ